MDAFLEEIKRWVLVVLFKHVQDGNCSLGTRRNVKPDILVMVRRVNVLHF